MEHFVGRLIRLIDAAVTRATPKSLQTHLARIRRVDRILAALLAGVAFLVFAFIRLADEVVEGDTRRFDEAVLLMFRSPNDFSSPIGPGWLPEMMRDFTALGGTGVLLIIVVSASVYLMLSHRRKTAAYILLAVVTGVIVEHLLKTGFNRPRPDLVPHAVVVTSLSFPSGHSMNSAVAYLTLGNLLAQTQSKWSLRAFLIVLSVFLTLLIGISRIYLGVHWPTDVLAGWTLGLSWAMICWIVMSHLQTQGKVERKTS